MSMLSRRACTYYLIRCLYPCSGSLLFFLFLFLSPVGFKNSIFYAKKRVNVLLIEKMYLILRRILSKVIII